MAREIPLSLMLWGVGMAHGKEVVALRGVSPSDIGEGGNGV